MTLLIRICNRLGRPLGINPFPRRFEFQLDSLGLSPYEVFETIFEENLWGSAQSRSGVGSETKFVSGYSKRLRKAIERLGIKKIFDAPCGDLNWMTDFLENSKVGYQGGDISEAVVAYAKKRHPAYDLGRFDIMLDEFPEADAWHCRDCLFHLPVAAVHQALRNFSESSIPYALITSHRAKWLHKNLDVGFGGFRFLDLERPPFTLGRPMLRISDYRWGVEFPRYVCIWSHEQIRSASLRWPTTSQSESSVN